MEICPAGENAADDRLVELAVSGDIAVSRDLALAKRLLEKNAVVIDDRGRLFTLDNINELLSLRNFTVSLAENGLGTERTEKNKKKELKSFADSLDRQITKREKETFLPAAVIFDMDGLMFDTENMTIPLWEAAGKSFRYDITYDILLRMIGKKKKKARLVLLEEFGGDFPYEAICDEFRLLVNKEIEENGVPQKPGLIYLLDRLRAAQIPLGVATSTRTTRAIDLLERAGIIERFKAITCGEEVTNGKPAPDIFLLATKKLGQPPGSCVGFEDSTAGLMGLAAAGIRSVFIKDLLSPPQEVLDTVWRRCNDLSEAAALFGL
jgi:HAD superfamily hydrolase (TIGR01509 family)